MAHSVRSSVGVMFAEAIKKAFPHLPSLPKMLIVPCQKAEQGDYQCNNAMGLHKTLQTTKKNDPSAPDAPAKPQDVAKALIANLPEDSIIASAEVAGPGFINIRLKEQALAQKLYAFVAEGKVISPAFEKQNVAVDFSSPNLAKEMHIGHLRSTIIGECICRILEFCGHNVHRINHVGDWGTQFGMLIAHLKTAHPDWQNSPPPLKDLVTFYREAKKRFDSEEDFKKRAQLEVVALQAGDETNMAAWHWLTKVSKEANQVLYNRLHITLEDRGESWYNPRIPPLMEKLTAQGLIKESQGAKVIWVDPEESKKPPLIMQKSDGGFGYATTDMAALEHRVFDLGCNRLVYVIDAGQEAHIQAFFKAGRQAGWTSEEKGPELLHAKFGVVCGADGKKFKTRSGDTVLLGDVLDEARDRAKKILEDKEATRKEGSEKFSEEEITRVSELVGVNAVKYFDLRQNRTTDYKFDYDRMLELKGNTAVYLLYTYARIRSLGRKGGLATEAPAEVRLKQLEEKAGQQLFPSLTTTKQERALGFFALRFYDMIEDVHDELLPHKIADYLYQLCEHYSQFYEECNVLKSEEPLRSQRIVLCEAVAVVLRQGLYLLGIPTLERL